MNNNIFSKLKGIVLLERGEVNTISKVELSEVIKQVFANIIVPKENEEIALLALSKYNEILSKVPLYRLKCNISLEAPKVVKDMVFKDE